MEGQLDQIIGSTCYSAFHQDGSACPHDHLLKEGAAHPLEERCEINERVFGISVYLMADDEGGHAGYVRVVRDITGQDQARAQLLKAEQFATLGQMISGIAHDVGTPLNIISGYCEYLMMKIGLGNTGHKELTTILQQTRRIAEFIRQMLDLARPPQVRADAIELKGFLEESLDLISHHLRKSDVRVKLICDITPPVIYGDAPRLRQAMFNVLLNACQKLGPKSEVNIHLGRLPEDTGTTTITLNGIEAGGIKHDFSKSLPEFISPGSSREALGLGLSLAGEVLSEFGATVRSEPQEDGGVSLVISLERAGLNGPAGKH